MLLSADARRLVVLDELMPGREDEAEALAVARDPDLEELVRIFHDVPERQRQRLLAVMRAAAGALAGSTRGATAGARHDAG